MTTSDADLLSLPIAARKRDFPSRVAHSSTSWVARRFTLLITRAHRVIDALGAAQKTANTPANAGIGPAILGIGIGFALIITAYTRGRQQLAGGPELFWAGQALVYGVGLFQAMSVRRTIGERTFIIIFLAAGQSLLTYAYSPVLFKFSDELQHWRTTIDIVSSHHLFTTNPTLPVSPEFPGLEIVTTFLVQSCHLSIFAAGVLVASACHVLLAVAAYALYSSLVKSDRIAALAAILFITSPHGFVYNSFFVYGALALPFFVLTLRATLTLAGEGLS